MAAICAIQRNIPNDSKSYMKHVLCPEDGDDLYTFIKSATPHWKDIARALKMTHIQTKDIISTPGLTQQSDYFQEMLHRWLKWAPPVHPLPTTEDLADALRAVGAEGVAYKLVKSSQFTSDSRCGRCKLTVDFSWHPVTTMATLWTAWHHHCY
ncbi:hypothetical protein EMCRGX_G024292 [Ephydatia muelleri]